MCIRDSNQIELNRTRCKAKVGEGRIGNVRVALAQPQTYMNLSGEAVTQLVNWYKAVSYTHLVVRAAHIPEIAPLIAPGQIQRVIDAIQMCIRDRAEILLSALSNLGMRTVSVSRLYSNYSSTSGKI